MTDTITLMQRPAEPNAAFCSGVKSVLCGLRRDRYWRYVVGVLKAFIDDSGSGGDSPWVVLAGYVATAEAWNGFEAAWCQVLADNPRIDCFHASEAESLRGAGQWAGVSKDERDSKLDRLIAVIQKFELQPISVRMRQSEYERQIKGGVPPFWDDPYYILLNALIVQFGSLIPDRFPDAGQVELVFDNHERHRKRGLRFYNRMADGVQSLSEIINPNIHYENDEDFPGLQAADLLAWQIRRAFSVTTEPRRRHYDDARSGQAGHPLFEFVLTRAILAEYMRCWNEYCVKLAISLGWRGEFQ